MRPCPECGGPLDGEVIGSGHTERSPRPVEYCPTCEVVVLPPPPPLPLRPLDVELPTRRDLA